MEKIAVDVLSLEVTRRCNMQPPCAHCFRGKAQNTVSSAFLKGELQICPKSAKIKKEEF